ncbi:hypothetical protein MMC27_005933 [Xylographa pallens]|nr:hypothetical protein [Xylographa pallens]
MPGRPYDPPTDTDPRTVRNSGGLEARSRRSLIGHSNFFALPTPLPGRESSPVPDHVEEPLRFPRPYSSRGGQVQFDVRHARVPQYILPIPGPRNNGRTNQMWGQRYRARVINAGPALSNGGPALSNTDVALSNTAEWAHLHAVAARSEAQARNLPYPRPPEWQDTAISTQTDRFSDNASIRSPSGETLVNTSTPDAWPWGLRSSSTERPSSLNPVDFRELEYVDAVDQNLVCPICQCPMVEPVETDCGHTFCLQCLRSAMEHQHDEKTCPSCRNLFHSVNHNQVNTLINRMLDDLVVRCVSKGKGCLATLARSNILDHVDRHCDFSDVACPDTSCRQILQRRQKTDDNCQHGSAICEYCPEVMPELELEEHVKTSCVNRTVTCHECKFEMNTDQVENHKSTCPEAIIQCDASPYGCIFVSKRKVAAAHTTVCPLSMLRPYLEAQQTRFEHYESTLERMQRQNNIYKEFMIAAESLLARRAPPSMPGVPPYHGLSQPAHSRSEEGNHEPANHLLALHQSLREEVARLRTEFSEVDARANTLIINNNLRHAEETSHLNATLAYLRTQVQWLVSSQRQRIEQRALRSSGADGNGQVLPGSQEGTSTNLDVEGLGLGLARRPNNLNRNDPKL